jgi:3-hydroxyisobutyrate dehydrogenase-like beta-hydroxyacid dehydrogenase
VLGLGEAGSRIAADLVSAGAEVRGYDPTGVAVPGVTEAFDVAAAVGGCDVVLALTGARAALEAAEAACPALCLDAIYADLSTGSQKLKQELAGVTDDRFVDVALLGPVPARGLGTPALASGPAAQAFANVLGPLGMPVEVVSDRPGDAAAMKLVRSVFMKGLAAATIESLDAAEALGKADWLRGEIAAVIGEPFLDRLVEGSRRHSARRTDEMEAARELLVRLGVEPRVAEASAALLRSLSA